MKNPAIVLGEGITALGTIRSLARENIPVYYIPTKKDFIRYSRWAKGLDKQLSEFPDSDELNRLLTQIEFTKAVLFPCSDATLIAASKISGEVSSRFVSISPNPSSLKYLIDKYRFSKLLMKLDLPHPRTSYITNKDDIKSFFDNNIEHFFLKPLKSQEFFAYFGVKAFFINSYADFLLQFENIRNHRLDVVLQEYIPGPPTQHYFIDGYVDHNGNFRAKFARQRLRMYPVDFGNSTYMKSIPIKSVSKAIVILDKLFTRIKFYGIFSAEFKKDCRDGLFKILEINARPWWYVDFATKSGINICKIAYNDALGYEINSINKYKINKRYVYPHWDFFAINNTEANKILKLKLYFVSWIITKKPIFSWDDPIPAIFEFMSRVVNRVIKIIKKIYYFLMH